MEGMNIQHTISELLRAGLTQTQIGDAIGLKQTSVSDMKSGKSGCKRPSHEVVTGLKRLAVKHSVTTEPPTTKRTRAPQVTPP